MKRPKLEAFVGVTDQILEADRQQIRKQRHTSKRIFERLRQEYGYTGGYTVVKDYVREQSLRQKEMFVPLSHPPGHAQVDFGEADIVRNIVAGELDLLAADSAGQTATTIRI